MRGIKKGVVRFCDIIIGFLNTHCYADSQSQRNYLIKNKVINKANISVLGKGSLAGVNIDRFCLNNFSERDKELIRRRRTIYRWTADVSTLKVNQPVTLTWDNGAGPEIHARDRGRRPIHVHGHRSVENTGARPLSLRPYALILRRGKPQVAGYSVLHEGFVGVIGDGSEQEITYASIEKETDRVRRCKGDGGWLGFTDKYWASAIIPDQNRADRRAFLGDRRAADRGLPDRFRRAPPTRRARREREGGDARLRRREGSDDHRRLREIVRHQEVRSDDRLGLVLFHHQAAVPTDPPDLRIRRQFRRRDPARHRAGQGALFPARQRELPLDGEDEDDPAADRRAEDALSRRSRRSSSRRRWSCSARKASIRSPAACRW